MINPKLTPHLRTQHLRPRKDAALHNLHYYVSTLCTLHSAQLIRNMHSETEYALFVCDTNDEDNGFTQIVWIVIGCSRWLKPIGMDVIM